MKKWLDNLKRFNNKNKDEQRKELESIYIWRGRARYGLRPFVVGYRIKPMPNGSAQSVAFRRSNRTRELLQKYIFLKSPPSSLCEWDQNQRRIWDEILPGIKDTGRIVYATHFIECGVMREGLQPSVFFKIALCLQPLNGKHSDYCCDSICGFLAWYMENQWDFTGSALDEQQIWPLRCVYAKWLNLRE